jgi:methyl-accepting chemotaxis protein
MRLSFRKRILLTIGLACAVCTLAAVLVARHRIAQNGEEALTDKSRAVLNRLESARDYVARMGVLENLVSELASKYPEGNIPEHERNRVMRAVPVFAAMKLGQEGSDDENFSFRVFSDNPRNPRNQVASAQEQKWIDAFRREPNIHEIVERTADGLYTIVVRPVWLNEREGCLSCHGQPSTSPFKNGKDVLGIPMENMKHGDLKGAFAIISSLEPVRAQTKAASGQILFWGSGFTLAALMIAWLILRNPVSFLNLVAGRLSETAQAMIESSQAAVRSGQDLRKSVKSQTKVLHETAVSVTQINETASHTADNAERSKEVSMSSRTTAEEGRRQVSEMIAAIEEIRASKKKVATEIARSNDEIAKITQLISEIGSKTAVINEIVFQTKLLSFNASIEAARAGQHGRGFAVVAEEVGHLARMSGEAAEQINTMLGESVKKVDSILATNKQRVDVIVREGERKVEDGARVASICGAVFERLLEESSEVNRRMQAIAVASRQQAGGVSGLSKSLTELDRVAEKSMAASEQAAQFGEHFEEQSRELQGVVIALEGLISGEGPRLARGA